MGKPKKGRQRDKKAKKPQKPVQLWKLYEAKDSSVSRKNKFCPKCGAGFFLAAHKNRITCGNCGYTEFASKAPKTDDKKENKKPEPKKEEKKPAKKEVKPAEEK